LEKPPNIGKEKLLYFEFHFYEIYKPRIEIWRFSHIATEKSVLNIFPYEETIVMISVKKKRIK